MNSHQNINNSFLSLGQKQYLLFGLPILFSLGVIIIGGNWLALLSSFLWLIMLFTYSSAYPQRKKERGYAVLLVVYVMVSFFLTAKLGDYIDFFIKQNYVLPYIAILLGYCCFTLDSISKLVKVLLVSAICFLVFFYFNMSSIFAMDGTTARLLLREENMAFDQVTKRLCIGSGFLLLLGPYIKKWIFWIAAFAMSVNIAAAIFMGRRGVLVTSLLLVLLAGYRFYKYGHMKRTVKILLLSLIALVVIFASASIISFFQDNPFFDVLANRIDSTSRDDVTYYFYLDMNNNPIQWLIGKGITSTYYCPGIVEDIIYRNTVETGWQHIIMKVGTPFLLVYLWLQIRSVIKCKKNFLTTACASYIMVMIIELLYAGVPTLDLRYALIWICVSLCNNREIQSLTDFEIRNLLKK